MMQVAALVERQVRVALWWVRRDLRLTDNQALASALARAERVIPVFVIDPLLVSSPSVGEKRLAFLYGGLRQFDAELRGMGTLLVVRMGDPLLVLGELLQQSGAEIIVAEDDFSPYARRRDGRVAARLPLLLVGGLTMYPPEAVLKQDGSPYTVFTPYSRRWRALAPPLAGEVLPRPEWLVPPPELASLPIPSDPSLPQGFPFPPGEREAQVRLQRFTDRFESPIYRYDDQRNRMDLAGTSGLSPYFRFGMLSIRQAAVSALAAAHAAPDGRARKSAESWLNELIWREFYISILYHFPEVLKQSFRANLREVPWRNDPSEFAAWCQGRTGYPVVDAAMRQLLGTGWMHNRARMIVASFLTKDLLIDWRWGERWFLQNLVDGDLAANNGGWQWSAGTGTDAAPYFRIFNPVTQGLKFDPGGDYVRHWVPELDLVPDQFIHEPWKMSLSLQAQIGCVIGRDYPAPMVDHALARERTLAAYGQAKDRA